MEENPAIAGPNTKRQQRENEEVNNAIELLQEIYTLIRFEFVIRLQAKALEKKLEEFEQQLRELSGQSIEKLFAEWSRLDRERQAQLTAEYARLQAQLKELEANLTKTNYELGLLGEKLNAINNREKQADENIAKSVQDAIPEDTAMRLDVRFNPEQLRNNIPIPDKFEFNLVTCPGIFKPI